MECERLPNKVNSIVKKREVEIGYHLDPVWECAIGDNRMKMFDSLCLSYTNCAFECLLYSNCLWFKMICKKNLYFLHLEV